MDLIKGRAYSIFVSELERHLIRAEQFFSESHQPSDEELRIASTSFHNIKGGAGFFGLEEIARIAGELESILSQPRDNLMAEFSAIRRSVSDLKQLQQRIPAPQKLTP